MRILNSQCGINKAGAMRRPCLFPFRFPILNNKPNKKEIRKNHKK